MPSFSAKSIQEAELSTASHPASHIISPYRVLATVPNTITGPATRNIFAAMPVTKPSVLKSMAGETTALAKPVMGTRVPAPARRGMASDTAEAGQLVVKIQACQQGGEKHQSNGGGGCRILPMQARGGIGVQNKLAQHTDESANEKGQGHILSQR